MISGKYPRLASRRISRRVSRLPQVAHPSGDALAHVDRVQFAEEPPATEEIRAPAEIIAEMDLRDERGPLIRSGRGSRITRAAMTPACSRVTELGDFR